MYCIKCGVSLQKGVAHCPLCGLKVYHPDLPEEDYDSPYPAYQPPAPKNSKAILLIVTMLLLIPMVLSLAIDLNINKHIQWSGYVIGGIMTSYLFLLLPLWFHAPNPVIFFPIDMAGTLLLTLYISIKTLGGWFLSFAFPVIGLFTVIIETQIVLIRYAAKNKSSRIAVVVGSGFIAIGAACILIEFLIKVTFGIKLIGWSFIPFTVLLLLGIAIIIIGLNRTFQDSLYKRFFI